MTSDRDSADLSFPPWWSTLVKLGVMRVPRAETHEEQVQWPVLKFTWLKEASSMLCESALLQQLAAPSGLRPSALILCSCGP